MNKLLNALPLLVGIFFVALIFLVKRLQDRGKPPPVRAQPPQHLIKASEASLKAFRQSFSRRRWIHRLLSYPAIVSGLLVVYLGSKNMRDNALFEFLGSSWLKFGYGATIFGLTALAFGNFFLLRCPACGVSLAPDRGAGYFVTKCHRCHLQFS